MDYDELSDIVAFPDSEFLTAEKMKEAKLIDEDDMQEVKSYKVKGRYDCRY